MSSNSKIWIAALVAGLVGLLLGAAVIFAVQANKVATLDARVTKSSADTQAALQKAAELQTALTALQQTVAQSKAPSGSSATTSSAPPSSPSSSTPTSTKATKQFTYITKVNTSGSAPVITADYAQMLTGKAAAAAATAHGDESPPPNDYYIVDDNKTLRKLKVRPDIAVTVTTNNDGTADPTGHTVTFDTWANYYAAPNPTNAAIRNAPYWITIKNGVVTAIIEQYLP